MNDYDFTTRQREILEQLCKGYSNKKIARNLDIAESTVKLHLTEVFKEMNVSTRLQALVKACDFPITTQKPLRDMTDLEILKEFGDVTFNVENLTGSEQIILLGRSLSKRI